MPLLSSKKARPPVIAYSCRYFSPDGRVEPEIGATHYSHFYAARRYICAIERLGLQAIRLPRPEIYGSDIARRFLTRDPGPIIHLSFGDYRSLRVLKGAYNIACVAWEYEAISGSVQPVDSLWDNQEWVLSHYDECWVGSTFTKRAFEQHGVKNVQVIPTPIPDYADEGKPEIETLIGEYPCAPLMFDFSMFGETASHNQRLVERATRPFGHYFLQAAKSGRPRVYLTIASPGDQRKNLEATVLGFAQFAADNPDALLVVKLTSGRNLSLAQTLWGTFRHRVNRLVQEGIVKSDAVLFVDGYMEDPQLMQLIASADFYVSTSFAEGLNAPVLEAMSRGAVVISPIHTAMLDYLTGENCISCDYAAVPVNGQNVTGYPIGQVHRNAASIRNVVDALVSSRQMSDEELECVRRAARRAVSNRYDMTGASQLIAARLGSITSRLEDA